MNMTPGVIFRETPIRIPQYMMKDYCKSALVLDWFRMIRFFGELIRFVKAFIVTVVGGVGELEQV